MEEQETEQMEEQEAGQMVPQEAEQMVPQMPFNLNADIADIAKYVKKPLGLYDLVGLMESSCLRAYKTLGNNPDTWPVEQLPFAAINGLIDICKSVTITYQQQKGRSTEGLPKVAPLKRLLIPMRETFLPYFKRVCETFADLPDDKYDWFLYRMMRLLGLLSVLGIFACTTKRGQEILPACREFWSVTFANLFCPKESHAKPKTTREEARMAYATLEDLFRDLSEEAVILSRNPKAAIPMAEADRLKITNELSKLRKDNEGLRKDNKGLREDNEGLRKDNNELREDNKELREENEEKRDEIKALEAQKNKGGVQKEKRKGKTRVRAKEGDLTQDNVAKDFHVTRQTVIKWENTQTEDGPGNTSNPYGYYRALRLDPNLRGSYNTLAEAAKHYFRAKDEAERDGIRFRVTFVRFFENWIQPNQKKRRNAGFNAGGAGTPPLPPFHAALAGRAPYHAHS